MSLRVRIAGAGAAALMAITLVPAPAGSQTVIPGAPAVPAVRTYPLQDHSLPYQLRARARARLPLMQRRVFQILGDRMDQAVLLPVQMVSALHICNAFRKRLGNAAFRSAIRVAWRESRLLPNIVNDRNRDKTEDWGLFQLNDGGTLQSVGGRPGMKALHPRWNARAAARLVAVAGWAPWGGRL